MTNKIQAASQVVVTNLYLFREDRKRLVKKLSSDCKKMKIVKPVCPDLSAEAERISPKMKPRWLKFQPSSKKR